MADIVFICVALAFFALCAMYVRWCDRIIGPDIAEAPRLADTDEGAIEEIAA
jgi:hypothetical protein